MDPSTSRCCWSAPRTEMEDTVDTCRLGLVWCAGRPPCASGSRAAAWYISPTRPRCWQDPGQRRAQAAGGWQVKGSVPWLPDPHKNQDGAAGQDSGPIPHTQLHALQLSSQPPQQQHPYVLPLPPQLPRSPPQRQRAGLSQHCRACTAVDHVPPADVGAVEVARPVHKVGSRAVEDAPAVWEDWVPLGPLALQDQRWAARAPLHTSHSLSDQQSIQTSQEMHRCGSLAVVGTLLARCSTRAVLHGHPRKGARAQQLQYLNPSS